MPKIEAFYTLEVKDKNGKTVSKVTKPCKSFVLQFLQLLECQFYPSVNVTIKDTSNVGQSATDAQYNFNAEAGVTDVTKGIVVGTGTTPVTSNDYVMETLIAHGVGATQLSYGATSKVTTAVVGANVDFQLIRTFNNGSGSTINVTEIGLYSVMVTWDVMLLHEIVTLTAVTNGQTLTVTITFRTTV